MERDQNYQMLKTNLSKIVRIWNAGLHLSLNMSKHMRPNCVRKETTDPVVMDVLRKNCLEFWMAQKVSMKNIIKHMS
jgi:hypothetical protein